MTARLTDAQLDELDCMAIAPIKDVDVDRLLAGIPALVAEVRELREVVSAKAPPITYKRRAETAERLRDEQIAACDRHVEEMRRERDAARAEIDRLRGLIQSELINDAHYCETCETAYQSPEGTPPRCTRCELDAAEKDVQAARSALREARAALAKAEAERDEADGELSKHIASANRYGSVTENTRRLASALGMREGKHTADSIAKAALEELTARRAEVERLGAQVNDFRAEHAAGPLDAIQIVQKDRDEWKRRAEAAVEEIKLLRAALSGRTVSCERCNETSREMVDLRAVADAAEHVVPMPPHLADALRKAGR